MTQQIWYVILYFKLSQALQGKFSYYEMITEFITAFCILLMYTSSGNIAVCGWGGKKGIQGWYICLCLFAYVVWFHC